MTWFGKNGVTPEAEHLYKQARQKVDSGEFHHAMTMLNRATEISPNYSQAYNELGVCSEYVNQHDNALAYYEKAIETDPFHADAWFNKGMSLKRMGRENESLPCIEKAIDLYLGR
jgi:tetratricopeptide (TPR) repeat protein